MKSTRKVPRILTDREKKEINKKFGININEDLSLFKVDFKIPREHTRQTGAKALRKLKDDLPDDIA